MKFEAFGKSVIIIVAFIIFLSTNRDSLAATLANAKDTITTSRPSASTPLATDQSAAAGSLTIYDNGSFFLSSDSAKLLAVSGQVENIVTIASMSAANTPTTGQRTLYLGTSPANPHHNGTPVIVPITAMHAVQFTTISSIPSGGSIVIGFPGGGNNTASPSASTFAFNNLSSSQIATNNASCTWTITAPNLSCVTSGTISPGTTVTILIGCSSQSSGTCTTQAPRLINPTKTQTAGTADIWKLSIQTLDSSSTLLDSATVSIGTIESVTVLANVDPSLTFTIAGIPNATPVNNGNTTGCLNTETTNTGIAATATDVNLGTLSNTPTSTNNKLGNIAAQLITISTNAANGYVLTATSASQLMNPATGYALASNVTPQEFPSNGANFFGIHGCGLDTYSASVGTTFWNTSASDTNCNSYIGGSSGNICKYGWPTTINPILIASDTTGPIGNSLIAGNGLTTVQYAAGADAGVPPGQYQSVITYVATPAF